MQNQSVTLAKIAALKKSMDNIPYGGERCLGRDVEHLFQRYTTAIKDIKKLDSNLFSEVSDLPIPEPIGHHQEGPLYEESQIHPLVNNLEYIMELYANFRIGERVEEKEISKRIFISHGRSAEWYKVQQYLERDLGLKTMELAQEPNLGRTVLQKLSEESAKCKVAVIIMTGDDIISETEARARENVMHEIGYFQGKYGLGNIILLHEAGVNIPSNIHGLVYIGFPKNTVEATYGALQKELKVLLS